MQFVAQSRPLNQSLPSSVRELGVELLPKAWPSVLAMLSGAGMHISFNLGGELYVGELMFLVALPFLLFDRFFINRTQCLQQVWLWQPMAWLLVGLMFTMAGYILSDFYRNNAPSDYLRGWARLIFLGIDLLVVALLISIRRSNIWYLSFGYAVIGLLILSQKENFINNDPWKFGYAMPITIAVIAFLCLQKKPSVHLRGVCLIGLGILHMFMDYRSLSAFCIIVALMGWIYSASRKGGAKIVMLGLTAVIVAAMLSVIYYASQGNFEQRRQASNSMRLSAAMVGINAVLESPFVGYGSWSKDARFAKQLADLQYRMSKTQENPLYDFDLIRQASFAAHSQILESWTEGGILGTTFFLFYLMLMTKGIIALTLKDHEERLDPLLGIFIIFALWALFLSPFKGLTRLDITFACMSSIVAINLAGLKSKLITKA
jgi:hypothetical protein